MLFLGIQVIYIWILGSLKCTFPTCVGLGQATNHVSSSQTNSFCEDKKQINESSVKCVGADSTKTVLEVCPVTEEWLKLFKGL